MPVELRSPKKKVMNLDGEYDPMIAAENETTWWVKCENCGKTEQGTNMELSENWRYEFTIDPQTIEITNSEAECYECVGKEAETPAERAMHDSKQARIDEVA